MEQGATLLTASSADIVTGQTDDSVITSLTVTTLSATSRIVTFYDENDVIIGVLTVAGTSGTAAGYPRLDVLADNQLARLEPFGDSQVLFLKATNKLRAKVDNAASATYIHWTRKDYAA